MRAPFSRLALPLALAASLGLSACSSSGAEPSDAAADAGEAEDATSGTDAVAEDTGTPQEDAGAHDAGEVDTGVAQDSGVAPDGGMMPLAEEVVPGRHVQVRQARIELQRFEGGNPVGDTFATVRQKLGPGRRSTGMGARSYEWSLGDVSLTVWFANTNLDDDDNPPNDVDDTDRVLWIAVQGDFRGRTPQGIGIGSTKAQVEAAHGPSPREVPLDDPPGTLAQYFLTGFLAAYNPEDEVRTLTISRAYPRLPDGEIDPRGARLRFQGGEIVGYRSVSMLGTEFSRITGLLGEPDARGDVTIGGRRLLTYSYAFIGIELFGTYVGNNPPQRVAFSVVHPPYYGTLAGGTGLGSPREQVEAALMAVGYDQGRASQTSASFLCHGGATPEVGVTYSSDVPPVATSFTLPLLQCP